MQLERYKYPAWHFMLALISPHSIPLSTVTETTFTCLFVMAGSQWLSPKQWFVNFQWNSVTVTEVTLYALRTRQMQKGTFV